MRNTLGVCNWRLRLRILPTIASSSASLSQAPGRCSCTLPHNRTMTLKRHPGVNFPLTSSNLPGRFVEVLQDFYSCDAQQMGWYHDIIDRLYTTDAQFHYPAAAFQGRDAIRSFWTLFLLQRALQRIDVTSTRFDASWDPAKLRLHVSIETWQHSTPLAWLDKLLPVPVWKVWTQQVFQFVEHPADGPGALRVVFQEEILDQFLLLGVLPLTLPAIRTDPGTPLDRLLSNGRLLLGGLIHSAMSGLQPLLHAVGVLDRPEA